MIGPQSLNPVTNVTLLCEEQGKYIAGLVSRMRNANESEVEPEPKRLLRGPSGAITPQTAKSGCAVITGT